MRTSVYESDVRIDSINVRRGEGHGCEAVVGEFICRKRDLVERIEIVHRFPPHMDFVSPRFPNRIFRGDLKAIHTNWYCIDHRARMKEQYWDIKIIMLDEIENFTHDVLTEKEIDYIQKVRLKQRETN